MSQTKPKSPDFSQRLPDTHLALPKKTSLSTNETKSKASSKKSSLKNKLKRLFGMVTVEPILCFYGFPQMLSSIAVNVLTFQMACSVNLNFNETICDDLLALNHSTYELQVQKEAAKLMVWKKPLATLVPAILILFMGSYSDRYNIRKPFMLIPLFGEVLLSISYLLCTVYKSLLPMEVLAGSEAFFTAITGGLTTVKIAVFSYVADVSSTEMRTTRLGIVQILSAIMTPIAFGLSGILFKVSSFYGVFSIRTSIFALGILYGAFRIKESKKVNVARTKSFCVEFFDFKNVKDTFKVLVRKRDDQKRTKLFLMLISFIIVKGVNAAEMDILFLYTRLKFQWDEMHFGFFITYDIVLRLIGSTMAVTIFTRMLKMDDLIVAPITFTSKIIGCCFFAFCPTAGYLYFGSVVSLMHDYQTVPIRSLATKLTESDEAGKVQSLFGLCEAIAPSIYVPLYSAVYRMTADSIPGAFYLVGAGTTMPLVPVFLVLYLCQEQKLLKKEEEEVKKLDRIRYIIPMNELS